MTILLTICTVSCVSWIITREEIFASFRTWAKTQSKVFYPLTCAYCLTPWVTAIVCLVSGVSLVWFFPVIWASYHSVTLFALLRKKVSG